MRTDKRPARYGRRLAACICAAAAALAISAVPAAAADHPLPGPIAPSGDFLDDGAKPVLDWSPAGRFAASWAHWDPDTATYDPKFVNPKGWSVNLNGCASTSVRRITSYTFTLAQLGTAWTHTRTTSACRLDLHNLLPAQGYYRATLTLHTDMGVSPGVSRPASRTVRIHDLLIVSIGDSLASGEGNPDVPGSYSISINRHLDPTVTKVNRPVQWQDRRCHRSAKGGPSLAARAFENRNTKTSVTFLSFACSGAEIRHLISDPYQGAEPPSGSSPLPPQVDAVSALVGPGAPRGGRPIDALLISIGINEIHFADIVERCAKNNNFRIGHKQCVTDGGTVQALDTLLSKDAKHSYPALADALRAKLPATREVYLSGYPAGVFRGGGCGVLGGDLGGLHVPGKGIDEAEGEEMYTWGLFLNAKIRQAAVTFRGGADRWNLVGDLAGPFDSHRYCDRDSWFTKLEQSWAYQGNENGTAHPNAAGHIAYANLLRQAMVPDQSSQPYRHLTITIKAVKVANGSHSVDRTIELTLFHGQGIDATLTRYLKVPQDGQWHQVPPELGAFTLDVFPAPASPRHATALYMDFGHILGITGTRSNNFDAGSHTTVHPAGSLAVSYTVTAESPQTTPTPLSPSAHITSLPRH